MTSSALRAETSSSFKSPAWAGDREDLNRLIRVVEDLRSSAAASIRLRHQESRTARFAEAEQIYTQAAGGISLDEGWWVKTWEVRQKGELEDTLQSIEVRIKAEHREFARVVEGPAEAVLDEIDVSDLVGLRLSVGKTYGSSSPGIEVRMNRDKGVQVEVRDQGSDWVRVAESKLKAAVSKQRPWYWWTRNPWAMGPVFLLPIYATARTVFFPGELNVLEEVTMGTLVSSSSYGLYALWLRLVPAFELHRVGSRARGSRVLAMVGTLALFILGIVVPFLLPTGK